jgi:hypothetical protein
LFTKSIGAELSIPSLTAVVKVEVRKCIEELSVSLTKVTLDEIPESSQIRLRLEDRLLFVDE